MPKEITNGILAFILCTILVLACYFWLDKPIVFWAYENHLRDYHFLIWFTRIPEVITGLAILLFPILVLRFFYKKWIRVDQVLFAILISLTIAFFIRGPLKIIFGRYWPATWLHNNPSLIRDNIYGFHWFHYGTAYAAFPSGHTTVTVAVMALLWIAYPKLRWLVVLIIMLVAVGLIGNYYHFLSDVIAGGFLGGITAYYIAKMSGIEKKDA